MTETVLPSALEAPSPPSATDPLTRLVDAMAAVGTTWTFALMFLVVADVVGRDVFKRPIVGVAEMAGNSIVAIVFLQLAAAIHHGRMTRADFLLDKLGGAKSRLVRALEAVFALCGLIAMGIITWAALPDLENAWTRNEFFGVQGLFTIPRWPIYALMVIGSVVSAIVYCRLALRQVSALARAPGAGA